MFTKFKGLLTILLGLLYLGTAVFSAPPSTESVTAYGTVYADDEDEVPEITDRVARVSFLEGEARIRRNGLDEWEVLAQNVPIVEGDEISIGVDGRAELQFGKHTHVRLAAGAYVRIATLTEENIALSLSAGTLIARLTSFDPGSSYFEIDAPKTTLAVQRSGRYRVDAGMAGSTEVRTEVTAGGEARIYSDSAGFTLKDDRAARVYLEGSRAGEWDTGDVEPLDAFADWNAVREDIIARRLKNANYNKYYDDDIYGADDLEEAGEWLSTPEYGNVWRPHRTSIARYVDWSPYRYGHWRYMPPYGWIWVNDEPWGWATYHYGRWVHWRGQWVWTPYGYYRPRRSWWSPAFVVINVYNTNVCWYPMGWRHRRNRHDHRGKRDPNYAVKDRDPRVSPGPIRNPPPDKITKGKDPEVPVTGVVTVDQGDFGSKIMRVKNTPETIAKDILTKAPQDMPPLQLPANDRIPKTGVATSWPKVDPAVAQKTTGAAPRRTRAPLDSELKTTRIFGGRSPRQNPETSGAPVKTSEPRNTGAVERTPPTRVEPVRVPRDRDMEPVRTPPVDNERVRPPRQAPVFSPPAENDKPRSTPRSDTPRQTERPRNDPPPVKSAPPPKSDSPKSQPKSDTSKPAPPPASSKKEKPD